MSYLFDASEEHNLVDRFSEEGLVEPALTVIISFVHDLDETFILQHFQHFVE